MSHSQAGSQKIRQSWCFYSITDCLTLWDDAWSHSNRMPWDKCSVCIIGEKSTAPPGLEVREAKCYQLNPTKIFQVPSPNQTAGLLSGNPWVRIWLMIWTSLWKRREMTNIHFFIYLLIYLFIHSFTFQHLLPSTMWQKLLSCWGTEINLIILETKKIRAVLKAVAILNNVCVWVIMLRTQHILFPCPLPCSPLHMLFPLLFLD